MLGINTTMFKVAAYALSAVFASLRRRHHRLPEHPRRSERLLQDRVHAPDDHRLHHRRHRDGLGAADRRGRLPAPLDVSLEPLPELHPTMLGLIIIFFIVFLPRGLMELFRRLRRRGPRRTLRLRRPAPANVPARAELDMSSRSREPSAVSRCRLRPGAAPGGPPASRSGSAASPRSPVST